MSTFCQTCYHIIFATKYREPVLSKDGREELFRYIWGLLKNKECHLYRINGVEDHVHILTSIHPSIAVSDLIKDIKLATSSWNKQKCVFPGFTHWQDGYGVFTVSAGNIATAIEYVKGQEEHHKTETPIEEFKRLLREAGIEFDPRYVE